ncbi:MAG: toprim domain-containing protein [Eggerthellaceae bacterium]|nr:toprim domain-containing protein [Eggerthellaceae bacterium]
MVSERERDDLRASMPDLLRERCGIVNLRRSFSCPSPGHEDSDPSAHYYENGHTVHCFGCGKTWDVFTLIGELDGIDGFAEQAKAVADIVGYRLSGDDGTPARPRPKPKPRPLFDRPREAGSGNCFEQCGRAFGDLYAPGNEVGRRYLRYRGLDDDDAARFGLGFTRNPRSIMPQFRVYEPEALGFITIPFWNRDFTVANYCMVRTISRGDVRNKEWRPKGVASPLWNEWMLTASLPVVFVAEGLIDAMAINKVLGKPTMALGGVANAKRLASILYHADPSARPDKVIVCMDEDDEGRKAAEAICGNLSRIGVANGLVPPYPEGAKDMDEWLMRGEGSEWDFEAQPADCTGLVLYRTRWRDGS